MDFNNLPWHDLVLKELNIDRNTPGKKDVIEIKLRYPNNENKTLLFQDVYWAKLNLNFGIVSEECIDIAYIADDGDLDLLAILNRWTPLIKNIQLNCYIIKTSSTGSEIKIIAKKFIIN